MENVGLTVKRNILSLFGIFCGYLVYFVVIWYILWLVGIHILWLVGIHILWLFGIFSGYLVYFSRFGVLHQEKSGNPAGN
jgi:hypothetical protein